MEACVKSFAPAFFSMKGKRLLCTVNLPLKPSVFNWLPRESVSTSLLRKQNLKFHSAADLFIDWAVLKTPTYYTGTYMSIVLGEYLLLYFDLNVRWRKPNICCRPVQVHGPRHEISYYNNILRPNEVVPFLRTGILHSVYGKSEEFFVFTSSYSRFATLHSRELEILELPRAIRSYFKTFPFRQLSLSLCFRKIQHSLNRKVTGIMKRRVRTQRLKDKNHYFSGCLWARTGRQGTKPWNERREKPRNTGRF